MFQGMFDHSSRSTFERSRTDVGHEGLVLSLRSNSSQRCSIWLRSGLCPGQSSSSTPNSVLHVFVDLLHALVHSHVRTGRGHPQTVPTELGAWNCPTSLGMLMHSEFLSKGTKGPSPAPEKQPRTIIPPPPNKYRSPGNRQTQTRPSDCQMEKHDLSLREHVSTALESSGGVLYTTAPDALHRTC